MPSKRLTFSQWKVRTLTSPEEVADEFYEKLNALNPHVKRSCVAAVPTRAQLLTNLRVTATQDHAPLCGVPYVLQDVFDTAGHPTLCGAPFPEPFLASVEQSSLLDKKLATLGANLLAKSTPAEFGIDPRGTNPTYGDCAHAESERYVRVEAAQGLLFALLQKVGHHSHLDSIQLAAFAYPQRSMDSSGSVWARMSMHATESSPSSPQLNP